MAIQRCQCLGSAAQAVLINRNEDPRLVANEIERRALAPIPTLAAAELRPGDLLFIPRGHPHTARSKVASTHLTIGPVQP
jgi:ribosomal protein L16 Arg81 hydroxylase